MSVPNHDWAKALAEPTIETIDHALQQTVQFRISDTGTYRFNGKGFVEKLTPQQTAAIHSMIRHAIAAELEKLVHSYNTRPGGLVSPANVAYHIAETAEKIRSWKPTWCVVTKYPDGGEDEQPFPTMAEAIEDAGWEMPGMTKTMRMR